MSKSVCTVREATLADMDVLAKLFNQYREFYGKAPDHLGAAAFLSAHLNQARSQIFVAQISEQLVGFIQLYPLWSSLEMGRVWVINDLFIQADHRGKAIGQALMQQAIAFAKAHDAVYIALETGMDNLRAQKLYQKLGFVIEDGIYHLHLNCK